MMVDITYSKKEIADKAGRITLCNIDRSILEDQKKLITAKVEGLQLDKATYKLESDRFQSLYVSADEARIAAVNAAPSRMLWFIAGVAVTMAAGIAAAMAAK
jgi:hypothetical protein